MKDLMAVLFIFSLIIGGIIIQTTLGTLDTSSWSFPGSNMASLFIPYLGGFLVLIGIVGLFFKVKEAK